MNIIYLKGFYFNNSKTYFSIAAWQKYHIVFAKCKKTSETSHLLNSLGTSNTVSRL